MSEFPIAVIPDDQFSATPDYKYERDIAATGRKAVQIRERLTVASATGDNALNTVFPAGFVLEGWVIRARDDATFATGVALGLGTTADPDLIDEVAKASVDDKNEEYKLALAAPYQVASAFSPHIIATDGSGAAAGTVVGDWDILFYGYTIPSISMIA